MENETLLPQNINADRDIRIPPFSDPPVPTHTSASVASPKKRLRLWQRMGVLFLACALFMAVRHFSKPRDKDALLPSAVYYHRVKKGMSQEEVENTCGRPEYAQQKNELGDEVESWFYSASDGSIEVYFDEGKVKKISRE